jgi:hypothetical protein
VSLRTGVVRAAALDALRRSVDRVFTDEPLATSVVRVASRFAFARRGADLPLAALLVRNARWNYAFPDVAAADQVRRAVRIRGAGQVVFLAAGADRNHQYEGAAAKQKELDCPHQSQATANIEPPRDVASSLGVLSSFTRRPDIGIMLADLFPRIAPEFRTGSPEPALARGPPMYVLPARRPRSL